MGRAAIEPGRWGRISLIPELQISEGKWVPIPEAERGRGDPRRWSVVPDRWRATARVHDADDGRVRQVSRYSGSKTTAEALLRRELEGRQAQRCTLLLEVESRAQTVAVAAAAWLDEARGRLAGSSYDTYRQTLDRHIGSSTLGALGLEEVKPSSVNELLQAVAQSSGVGAAKLVRSVLNGTFEQAVASDAVLTNPVRQARPVRNTRRPRPAEGERDTRRALTRNERDRLIRFVYSDPYCQKYDLADLIAFMAGTGVRVGEAIALQWKNLDLDRTPAATIAATISRVTGEGNKVQTSTKTGRDRVVYLPPWLAERLRARRDSAETQSCRAAANREAVVFDTPPVWTPAATVRTGGNLRDRSNTTKQLRRVYDAAGFPWMTSHTMRRTAASLLDDAGVPMREVSSQLGHTDLRTTYLYLDRRQATTRAADVL